MGIHQTTEYLERFLENLLLKGKKELKNRYLHVSNLLQAEKVDINTGKVDIEIRTVIKEKLKNSKKKTVSHALLLFDTFGLDGIFGRNDVIPIVELKESSASKFLQKLVEVDVIEQVSGHGKGHYKFKE